MSVLVIGAGIIGASISKYLAEHGAKVTVLESAPAPAQGATGKSWAWLNANYKNPRHYRGLNLQSMQLWRQNHPGLCHFNGCLMLHDARSDPQDPSYPSHHIPASELQLLEPALSPTVVESATTARLFPLEGWCDPVEATQAFLADAQQQGAQVLYSQQVQRVTVSGTGVKVTAHSTAGTEPPQQQRQQNGQEQQQAYTADVLVVASGTGSPALAKQLGYELPLLHKPALIVMTAPVQQGLLKHMVISNGVFMLQRLDGRVLLGETHPKEASNTDASEENAQRILQLAAASVPALQAATIEGVDVGYRPYPQDGYPVLGWINSKAYIAVTHSGMTLAPLVGQLVVEEVVAALPGFGRSNHSDDGSGRSSAFNTEELLAPYRPSRLQQPVACNGQER